MSEDILMDNALEERERVIFIRPHAQFPEISETGDWRWTCDADKAFRPPSPNRLIELIGRVCYKSEDRITDDSAARFLKMLVDNNHISVVEHLSLTVKCVGSRAMSHQLVRHRIAAYSQESQRYCNYGRKDKLFAVVPPTIHNAGGRALDAYADGVAAAYASYLELLSNGIRPEDARHLLPNAAKTEVVATLNLRQWRHVIEERALNSAAQWEIRRITLGILRFFNTLLPEIFGDLWTSRQTQSDSITKDVFYKDEM